MTTLIKLSISQPMIELPPVILTVHHGRAVPLGPAVLAVKGGDAPCFATMAVAGPGGLSADLQFPDERTASAFHVALVDLGEAAALDIDGLSLLLFAIR